MNRFFRNEDGSGLVEFALSASVMLSVLIGLFYMCMALFTYNYVTQTARNATRYAIVRGADCINFSDCGISDDGIEQYVQNVGLNGMSSHTTWYQYGYDSAGHGIWNACSGQCNAPGNAVSVNVTYSLPLNIPFVPQSALQLSSTSQLVISQ